MEKICFNYLGKSTVVGKIIKEKVSKYYLIESSNFENEILQLLLH